VGTLSQLNSFIGNTRSRGFIKFNQFDLKRANGFYFICKFKTAIIINFKSTIDKKMLNDKIPL